LHFEQRFFTDAETFIFHSYRQSSRHNWHSQAEAPIIPVEPYYVQTQ
jgi:hypothetical protein